MIDMVSLLRGMLQREASDLHLKAGHPPVVRVHGQLVPQPDWPVPDEAALQEVLDQHRAPALSADVEAELERIARRYLGPAFHFGRVTG